MLNRVEIESTCLRFCHWYICKSLCDKYIPLLSVINNAFTVVFRRKILRVMRVSFSVHVSY